MNIRVQAEDDLSATLEDPDGFGLPVFLIDPDGVIYDKSANDVEQDLSGQVLYDTIKTNPETGLQIVVHKPVVTLRRTSLTRVPLPGEAWMIAIPEIPDPAATKILHKIELAPEDGKSIGFIRLYLTRTKQKS